MQANGKDLPAPKSRTGHGAASVIPHLNDMFPLEPSQLLEPEDPAWEDKPAADVQQESL